MLLVMSLNENISPPFLLLHFSMQNMVVVELFDGPEHPEQAAAKPHTSEFPMGVGHRVKTDGASLKWL